MSFDLLNFQKKHLSAVKEFTDRWIGEGYFSQNQLKDILIMSQRDSLNASYLAYEKNELVAVRLSFAPGDWVKKMKGLSFSKWSVPESQVGYFKSLFVAQKYQRQGLGRKLSLTSLSTLQQMGARAVVCHCWAESPGGSSQRYLESFGFKKVAEHPNFWQDIDYLCTRCAPQRCQCCALEMIKKL